MTDRRVFQLGNIHVHPRRFHLAPEHSEARDAVKLPPRPHGKSPREQLVLLETQNALARGVSRRAGGRPLSYFGFSYYY